MTNKTVLLELLNLNQLVDERVLEALKRLDQIDDLALWYGLRALTQFRFYKG
jgi:hypothetical protein